MRIYQTRFRAMKDEAKKEQALALQAPRARKPSLKEKVKEKGWELKDGAEDMVMSYLEELYGGLTQEVTDKIGGQGGDANKGYFKKGSSHSIVSLFSLMEQFVNKGLPGKRAEELQKLIEEGNTPNLDELKKELKDMTDDMADWKGCVDMASDWLDATLLDGLIGTEPGKVGLLTNLGKELLQEIPFAGLGFKAALSGMEKMFGHYLRPLVKEEIWLKKNSYFRQLHHQEDPVYEAIFQLEPIISTLQMQKILKDTSADGVLKFVEFDGKLVNKEVLDSMPPMGDKIGTFYLVYFSQADKDNGILHPVLLHQSIFQKPNDFHSYSQFKEILELYEMTTIDTELFWEASNRVTLGKCSKDSEPPNMYCGITSYGQLFFTVQPHDEVVDKKKKCIVVDGKRFDDLIQLGKHKIKEKKDGWKLKENSWYKADDLTTRVKGKGEIFGIRSKMGNNRLNILLRGKEVSTGNKPKHTAKRTEKARAQSFNGSLDLDYYENDPSIRENVSARRTNNNNTYYYPDSDYGRGNARRSRGRPRYANNNQYVHYTGGYAAGRNYRYPTSNTARGRRMIMEAQKRIRNEELNSGIVRDIDEELWC